ncbi:hypothetical protein D3C79_1059390 [compost metagenome]
MGGGKRLDGRVGAGVVKMGVPQRLPGASLANFVFLQVILARAFESASFTTAHDVDFIFA